jgi:ABC-2 type transport system permease protein
MSVTTQEATATRPASPRRADLGPIAPVPLGRLVRVETRKQVDTLAGRWFLVTIGLVVALVVGIMLFVDGGNHSLMNYLTATSTPLAVLLPILGIMTATAEWGQRTAMTTFALEPRRGRVVLAKIISSLLLGALAFVVAFALAALAHGLAVTVRDATPQWEVSGWVVGGAVLLLAFSLGQGLAFGMALLNTPAAIVAYLVLPMVWSILTQLITWMRDVATWLDPSLTLMPLSTGEAPTGEQWAQIGTSMALWLALPLAVGVWRVLHREVK